MVVDKEKLTTSLEQRRICSSFPPLDPNGQPFSMLLRGAAAELGDLRCTISSIPNLRHQLVQQLQNKNNLEVDGEDKFEDVDVDLERQANQNDGGQCEANRVQRVDAEADTHILDDDRDSNEETENKKRSRGDEENDEEHEESDDEIENTEQLLFYMPSVTCTCSSWKMKEVQGDMFITSLRVLFLPEKQGNNGEEDQWDENDIAIDGRFIALHAVDSLPSTDDDNDEADVSHHVYCQLAEAMGDNENMGYTSAISMVAPTIITEENNDDDDGNDDIVYEENASFEEDDSTLEVYFKPTISDKEERDGSESQCNKCQNIFDSLTKLITLNPAGDSDEGFGGGGGLFNMLSLMAGIGDGENGLDGEMVVANHDNDEESDDDMIIRLGGSNNLVENDNESDGADDGERQAMLRRLDDLLVVPPEYEIPSEDDAGQFSDAEEEEDDAIL